MQTDGEGQWRKEGTVYKDRRHNWVGQWMSLPELEERRKSPSVLQAAGVVNLKLGRAISDNVSLTEMLQ
jgi:hypothetical protein